MSKPSKALCRRTVLHGIAAGLAAGFGAAEAEISSPSGSPPSDAIPGGEDRRKPEGLPLQEEWVFTTTITAMKDGSLTVRVAVRRSEGGPPVRRWTKRFAHAASHEQQVDDFGRRIAGALAALKTAKKR